MTPAALAANKWFIDLYRTHHVAPPSAPTDGFLQTVNNMKAGRTAMTIHHIGSANDMVAALGAVFGLGVYATNGSPLIAGAAALVGGFGLPSWFLSFRKKRRLASFVNEFPNAVDIVIRGVKAGLPLGDCLRIIATESPEPLRSEFRQVVEAQAVGLTVTEAVERMAERVPVTESHFFAIVIGIQQKSGGNLTEALGNLSRVIRDRKKMRGKIKAVSSEAKASAGIIGALPFVVGGMVYLTSPDYMSLLFTTNTGRFIMLGCACWMGIGIFVMKKMIAFDI